MRMFARRPERRTSDEPPLAVGRAGGATSGFDDVAPATRFRDVAGIDPVVDELRDIVEHLREPDRFAALGARAPRGVLLFGSPGCGKTLLGRAVAGEVEVPFYFASATSFVERFVGLGASRVRELFDAAAAAGGGIVFIDEIDAVGRRRSDAGGDREFDHTLNQLLVELDGFLTARNTIVIAATNRPELLDPALVRPGRLDRKVEVPRPDAAGRVAVLRLHASRRTCEPGIDWDVVAEAADGCSAAELAALVNDASLLAGRRRAVAIGAEDVDRAVDRLVRGSATAPLRDGGTLRRLARHEAGHAVVALCLPDAHPPSRVSLGAHRVGDGAAGVWSPSARRAVSTESELSAELVVLMAGRAAERELAGGGSTLAEDDLSQARLLAERMELAGLGGESTTAAQLLRRAEREAAAVVRRERVLVQRVADALHADGSVRTADFRARAGVGVGLAAR